MTPTDTHRARFQSIHTPDITNVRKPITHTGSSERHWIATTDFSSRPVKRPPVVMTGPKPLPLKPLLNAPKIPKITILDQEKSIFILSFLLKRTKNPNTVTSMPMYSFK